MKITIYIFRSVMFLSLSGLLFTSCNSEGGKDLREQAINIPDTSNSDHIVITENQFKAAQMQVGTIKPTAFDQTVKANGVFTVPPERKASVSPYFSGYVKELSLLPGDQVRKGQVLFTLENPDYIRVQQRYLEAKGQLRYLDAEYKRQQELMKDQITSEKNLLKAEADYSVIKAQYESLKKQLWLMNINPNTLSASNLRSTIAVIAPIEGHITKINTQKGAYLNPSDMALSITDTKHLQIKTQVFEKNLPQLKAGQPVVFKVQNGNEGSYHGTVKLINKAIDEHDRTASVYIDLKDDEAADHFAPGMYVEVAIVTAKDTLNALPEEAVVSIDNDHYGLVRINETTFKQVGIKIGKTSNGYVEIVNPEVFESNTVFLTKGTFEMIME
ncbi:membrane fusion protein, cobalt-zinc-cadmium efflux system [Zhouia amylolytica]|uniref:Membrane fusion protein, cobalt-zinc-cadmium efflux system n=1 Tax=Zhouia amylolytica TaxID=376730 RepID=A0A1I6ULK6_9FLAO|nr:efflux RND transporter periplasmic adaptor subunit [Zhouia amylolytica]SFT02345.1 membrane fusion protein, cobalt-zinc-cadmium efflux system [Zhouia amylolytica]